MKIEFDSMLTQKIKRIVFIPQTVEDCVRLREMKEKIDHFEINNISRYNMEGTLYLERFK